jgi:hypothetical protein
MRSELRTGLVLLVTVALLAFFLRNADLSVVWAEVRRAEPGPIVGSVAAMAVVYVVRALRWQYLLRPIGHVRFWTALQTTIIGFAVSSLLPARPGEVLRPYLLARREGLSFPAAFATIFIERVLDLVTVLLLFGAFVLVFDPGMKSVDPRVFGAVELGGAMAAAAAIVAVAAMIAVARHPERLGRAALRVERVLPARAARAVARLVERFAGGLAVMRRPRDLVAALALSMPLWLAIAASIWLVPRAFQITVPFTGSFLLLALLVVGVAVPTPGGIGGFHEAFRIGATAFYGVANDRAVGAAIVLHATQFVPVVVVGIALMAREGLTLGGMQRLADSSGVSEVKAEG